MGFRYSHDWVRDVMERGGCIGCMEEGTDPILTSEPCMCCNGTGLNPHRKGTYYADGTLDTDTKCDERENIIWKYSK